MEEIVTCVLDNAYVKQKYKNEINIFSSAFNDLK